MSFAPLLPWFVVLMVLLLSWWQQRRYRKELNVRQSTEATLHATETTLQRMYQAIESASDAIGIGDFSGTSLYHNRAHRDLFGYSVEELNAIPEAGVLFADVKTAGEIHASLQKGRSWSGEVEVKSKGGRCIPAFVRADIIRDENNVPVGIFGVFTDITERRQAAQALVDERQRLAITLESIGEGVITTDQSGRVDRLNHVAEQLTGWSQQDARGQLMATVLPLFDEQSRLPRLAVTTGDRTGSQHPIGKFSCVLVMRDGRERLIAAMATPLRSDELSEQGAVVVFRDIADDRRLAEEKERTTRLESLGLLAGGIAHDFANLLTAIMGHLSLAQTTEHLPQEAAVSLSEVERAAWRARDLTKQLLTFAKGGTLQRSLVALGGVIRESVAFAMHDAGGVVTEFQVPDDLWPVDADEGQLGQVINNLALNAVQAMGQRGLLRIVARNVEPGVLSVGGLAGRAAVHVQLVDTGPGIPAESLSKIFDPFFTTKAKGTGLGLATVYSIVKKHGGHIHVESKLGLGTTFDVYLPAERVPTSTVRERHIN